VVERAVYRSDSSLITDIVFDPFRPSFQEVLTMDTEANGESTVLTRTHPLPLEKPFSEAVLDLEIQLLKSALKKAQFNQRRAARILGLTYHQFRGLYRKHKGQL